MNRLRWLCLSGLVFTAGCGSGWDDRAALDAQIEESWLVDRELVDAVDFFENGGQYEDSGDPAAPAIDRPTILPLVRQLRDDLGLEVQAVLEEPQVAFALLVEVPEEETDQARLRDVLKQADREFFGLIMHHWGYRWISLDFFDEAEMALLEETGVLEEVQQQNQ